MVWAAAADVQVAMAGVEVTWVAQGVKRATLASEAPMVGSLVERVERVARQVDVRADISNPARLRSN